MSKIKDKRKKTKETRKKHALSKIEGAKDKKNNISILKDYNLYSSILHFLLSLFHIPSFN